ncbi:MAG TPA: thiamine pyrophosphate-dependent enzyme [Saprospiraceae bacterium]|nr:thiamine pyrophosphate-dependent enzyme [Saprospiraceae bacterium]HMP24518.1 thiamine pyrophosphate-dependent enzyme [Saprospiraceae bacterium]
MVKNSDTKTPVQIKIAKGLTLSREEILQDFELCCLSREVSLLGRKEVLTGKAKFGIFGDGKEVPQVAMAKAFKNGDFRAGYYRDQTFAFATGISSIEGFFAQLYADADNDPHSGGRQMISHFATPFFDEQGHWLPQKDMLNNTSGISPTAGQMARALGLALASKKYREIDKLRNSTPFSHNGEEVCFCTIGDASTSEGAFWETINAAGVMQVPLSVSVWDDGYGISVPIDYQTTKGSISEALEGFRLNEKGQGIRIYTEKAWNYPGLVQLYMESIAEMRQSHVPALLHIQEVTQPQGHSTSGSHERYKSKERLDWEREHDCILQMERWMIAEGIATEENCKRIREKARKTAKEARDRAWRAYSNPTQVKLRELKELYNRLAADFPGIDVYQRELGQLVAPVLSEMLQNARRALFASAGTPSEARAALKQWIQDIQARAERHYHTHLYSESPYSALRVPIVAPEYASDAPLKNGFEIMNAFFDKVFQQYPNVFAFGEDVGQIGDVNQGFAGLQKKYGEERIFDTGIREWTIIGQAIGMAMRGLRPIAEIQYLDYLVYAMSPLTDDLATVRYRSNGIQQAPAIIRTRGHRLEGIWHAGSPMGMLLHSLRGMYLLTPRNMTQAAGFYNTMLQSDDPALIIECLNGYRLKEKMPANIGAYTVPLGVPEVLETGTDVTLVTYGSCVRVAQEGIRLLRQHGISVELIDVQSLLPFDLEQRIVESLKKTNRIVFMDEDVPGGATAFMMQEVLEKQGGYRYLDSAPATLTAHAHRPPYGSDGDYFSKPNPEDVFEVVYNLLREANPQRFPALL